MGREELARLTDEFLERGGKITKCPDGQMATKGVSDFNPRGDGLKVYNDNDNILGRDFFEFIEDGGRVHFDEYTDRRFEKIVSPDGKFVPGCRHYLPEHDHD